MQCENKKKKLRSNQGFTLIEMLITTLIMGLVTVMIASSIQTAFQVYTKATQASEGQVLCDTLVTAVQDELRYATDFQTHGTYGFTYTSRSKGYGKDCHFVLEDGRLKIQKDAGTANDLLPEKSYNNGLVILGAKADGTVLTSFTLNDTTKMVDVTLVVGNKDGNELATQTFSVKPLNGIE